MPLRLGLILVLGKEKGGPAAHPLHEVTEPETLHEVTEEGTDPCFELVGQAHIRGLLVTGLGFFRSKNPNHTSPRHLASAQSTVHTRHAHHTCPGYVGLRLHVNVAAHGRERTRKLVVV